MRSIAGSGELLTAAGQVAVAYDLQEAAAGLQHSAEGTVYGVSGSLRPVYLAGPCRLRLESGSVIEIVLTDCNARGVADVRVTGAIAWHD